MRILLINAEFSTYEAACRASYAVNYGLEEAFTALGHETVTVPLFSIHDPRPVEWDRHIEEILGGRTFDQVWFEICHSHFDEGLYARFRELAPVRVGVIWETMRMSGYERATSPYHVARKDINLLRKIPLATHLLAVDYADAADFERFLGIPSFWMSPAFINRAFIKEEDPEPKVDTALFYGTAYGHRKSWLEHPRLRPLLSRPDSPEWATSVPKLYDQLIQAASIESKTKPFSVESFSATVRQMKKLRRLGFEMWMEGLKQGIAVVNLPQIGSTIYAGRVIESMAAARVSLTPEIGKRPRNHALFQEGAEIFHYPVNGPDRLAKIIIQLQNDPALRREMGLRARKAILERHTTELFVSGIFRAIADGVRPPEPGPLDPSAVPEETASGIKALLGLVSRIPGLAPQERPATGPLSLAQRETLQPRPRVDPAELASFLDLERDRWLVQQATTILPGSSILELRKGEGTNLPFFEKCVGAFHDLEKAPLSGRPGASLDIVLCSEILPRVSEPAALVAEAARLLKPGGRLLLTASFAPPLGVPDLYYGGFAPGWYRHFLRRSRLCIVEMRPNGGFFRWVGRQFPRAASALAGHDARYGPHAPEVVELLTELLPAYLFDLESRLGDYRLTDGYLVQALKVDSLELAGAFLTANPDFVELYRVAADLAAEAGKPDLARDYWRRVAERDPNDREAAGHLAVG